jgi:hypothetical protein
MRSLASGSAVTQPAIYSPKSPSARTLCQRNGIDVRSLLGRAQIRTFFVWVLWCLEDGDRDRQGRQAFFHCAYALHCAKFLRHSQDPGACSARSGLYRVPNPGVQPGRSNKVLLSSPFPFRAHLLLTLLSSDLDFFLPPAISPQDARVLRATRYGRHPAFSEPADDLPTVMPRTRGFVPMR